MDFKNLIDMNIILDTQSRISVFFKLVKENMSFLENLGYVDIEEKLATQYVVKDIVEVLYKNINLDRVIIVYFEPNSIDNTISNFLSVSIYNGIELMDRELLFILYINKYMPEVDVDCLTYIDKNKGNSFEENIQTSLAGYTFFLKEIGSQLLDGSEWEDGLYYSMASAEKLLYEQQKRIFGISDREENMNRETPIDYNSEKQIGNHKLSYDSINEIAQGSSQVGIISIDGKIVSKDSFGAPVLYEGNYLYIPRFIRRFCVAGFKLCRINMDTLEIETIGSIKDLIFLDRIEGNRIYYFENMQMDRMSYFEIAKF